MNFQYLLLVVSFQASYCLGHSTPYNVDGASQLPEIGTFSMPNLVQVRTIDELTNNWEGVGQTDFKEGRIILTPKPPMMTSDDYDEMVGALWSLNSHNGLQKFTIEATLRSIGSYGVTGAGLSLFLVDENFNSKDQSNFGGPLQYKGLQLLINNDSKNGASVKLYLNDGTRQINLDNDYFGTYLFEFQDSNVPFTVKIGYSDNENHWFKISIDNKMLFETNEINLQSLLSSKIKLGISGKTLKTSNKHEQFEILRLKTLDGITEDMKKKSLETLYAKHGEANNDDNSAKNREKEEKMNSFMEAQMKLRNQLLINNARETENLGKDERLIEKLIQDLKSEISFDGNTHELAKIEEELKGMNIKFNMMNDIIKQQNDIINKQNEMLDVTNNKINSIDKLLRNQFNNFDTKLTGVSKLLANKDEGHVQKHFAKVEKEEKESSSNSTIVSIMLLVLLLLVLLSLLVFKLRNDIKHSKIL